jgi:hypothetical protein
MEKCIRWIRNTAPELFWSALNKPDVDPQDYWKCFEMVHHAATVTAQKFVTLMEKVMKPGDFIKCGSRRIDSVPFMCQTISGVLLASEKQKEIPYGTVEDIFDKFYVCGFRAILRWRLIR